jgi:phosphonate ABC transporter permease subunit PhnE
MKNKNDRKASIWKSAKVGLATLLGMVVLAYGFQITKVNLQELSSKTRQESLIRVARALAKPDFFEFDQEEEIVNAPVYVPCPAGDIPSRASETPTSGPYLIVTPACAAPGEVVQVEGFGFTAKGSGPLRFIPGSDPKNTVTLGRNSVEADSDGHFLASLTLPERESPDVQFIRASLYLNTGSPHITQSARDTWNKIVETVFLALLATVFGTILAIPLSFLAARNLMKPVKSTLISVALSILGGLVGIVFGYLGTRVVGNVSSLSGSNVWINLVIVLICPLLMLLGIRWALPQEENASPLRWYLRLARLVVLLVVTVVAIFWLYQLAGFLKTVGTALVGVLANFGFLGNFLYQVGQITLLLIPVLGGLVAGGAVSGILGRLGQQISERASAANLKVINLVLTPIALAAILTLLGELVELVYQIGEPLYTLWIPLVVGVLAGILLATFFKPKQPLPIGMVIYFITRSFLNALRSVEALVMAIVFVIAVGIGPFAGVLALGLHTIVSLAKLYSEQVESILQGPLEAVQATGANRLQMIVYAVIPQIIPPYISYTMYRWDTNVRMSTIIGFVGGGGIGFLLQQNINLLNYRGASAQMVAIAVVVATMDYISSVLREKTI